MTNPRPQSLPSIINYLRIDPTSTTFQNKILVTTLDDPQQTIILGQTLADIIIYTDDDARSCAHSKTPIIGLSGTLGAGKTLLTSSFIHQLLPKAEVSSPTFSLVEEYSYHSLRIFHLDLYRVKDIDELESIGFWDFCSLGTLSIIEWAERCLETLTNDAVIIELLHDGDKRVAYLYTTDAIVFDAIYSSLKDHAHLKVELKKIV